MSRQAALLCALLVFVVSAPAQDLLDSLGITVRGASRSFAFTNKESAFLYGETNSAPTNSWQGFNVFGREFLDDYDLVIDGRTLDRRSAVVTVYPDFLRRVYPEGFVEEVRPVDSLALFAVHLTSPGRPVPAAFVPWFSDGRDPSDFILSWPGGPGGAILVARSRHRVRTPAEDYPAWLAMQTRGGSPVQEPRRRRGGFSPVILRDSASSQHIFVVAVADSAEDAGAMAGSYLRSFARLHRQRHDRLVRLLSSSRVVTDDPRWNRALAWAKVSLDALMMNQKEKGIFAGLPWFDNYWGRDTFISLPGATLVTGRCAEARQILLSFSAFQNLDSLSADWGRIPNIVTTTDKAYNTADGTPRFVAVAHQYVERSGDTSFIRLIYPAIRRAAEGTIRYHTDSLGFLVHGDAETWMDAVGPDGPWSPRGNRANDIQALWVAQLDASLWFARRCGDSSRITVWKELRDRCAANFLRYFVRRPEGALFDRLRADGSGDSTFRPNQLFTGSLLGERTREEMIRAVTSRLAYEYGVASLSQDDPNFHPYHQYEPYYPKDAAYHNGTVWTWLQGSLISELCRIDRSRLAYRITRNSIHQILDRGAVGTQSELIDAIRRPGESEPRLSGTFSQAWNLAEFVRNFYDDYLGVRVDMLRHQLVLRPHLPLPLARVNARLNLGGGDVSVALDLRPGAKSVTVAMGDLHDSLSATLELPLSGGRLLRSVFMLLPRSTVILTFNGDSARGIRNGLPHPVSSWVLPAVQEDSLPEPMALASPVLRPGLKALRGPSYPLLSRREIKADNPHATTFVDVTDPEGDDRGYQYPRNSSFLPGSFDLTHFTVRTDTANFYFTLRFRALSDPGWHPEYGFQLTFLAISIDQDGIPGSGTREIPANASYMLPPGGGYERLILVGGGVRIEDASRTVLAEYIPVSGDESNPLGDARSATVAFAVPRSYLGAPTDRWTFTVLAGAQDDHGGAGLGEFRTVNAEPGEWNGGGKTHPADPNVYDTLVARPGH